MFTSEYLFCFCTKDWKGGFSTRIFYYIFPIYRTTTNWRVFILVFWIISISTIIIKKIRKGILLLRLISIPKNLIFSIGSERLVVIIIIIHNNNNARLFFLTSSIEGISLMLPPILSLHFNYIDMKLNFKVWFFIIETTYTFFLK